MGKTCDALHDLVQFKKQEKHAWRSVTFSKVAACNRTKSNTPPWAKIIRIAMPSRKQFL